MRKKDLTKNQIEYLQINLKQGKTKEQIAKEFNMHPDTLRKALIRQGFDVKKFHCKMQPGRKTKNYSFINKEWLIDNWINTSKSLATLAKEFNVSLGMLEFRASSYSLTKKYKHKVNINKFENLQDVHLWYLAGLIATDGHIDKNHDAITIRLRGESEKSLLSTIANYYDLNECLKSYHNDKDHELRIAYDGISTFLEEHFGIPKIDKTFTVDVPKSFINEECVKAYLLGCIDGDGYISKYKKRETKVTICCGSDMFISGLVTLVNQYLDINAKVTYHKGTTKQRYYPELCLTGRNAMMFLDWMYSVKDCFKLERKYQSYIYNKLMR